MSPWEIWTYDFPTEGTHPCVIFSNASRLAHPAFERINVFLCRIDAVHFISKSGLRERRGVVCKERRRQICQRMLKVFPFEF